MKLSPKFCRGIFGFALGEMPRAFSKTPQGQAFRRRSRASHSMGRALLVLALLVLAVGVALAGHRSQSVSTAAAIAPQNTAFNGPGNVFLTANLFSPGGTGTAFVAVADINGDGKLDYVTANPGNNTIAVALGNGDGTFQAPKSTGVACNPTSVAIGDFNHDGKLDLAVSARGCSAGTNGVTILLGNGDGTFTAKGTLTSSLANPFSAVVGDFNGDGKLDLAVIDHGFTTESVFLFLGNGDGTFQAPTPATSVNLGANVGSNQIVAADFNKDGHLDVAVSHTGVSSSLFVILGNGDGTFQAPRSIALPAASYGIAVGDFNGDGVPDLVATTPADAGISVFLGKGDGNFNPVNNPVSGTLPTTNAGVPGQGPSTTVAVGDFNGDGKPDVIVALGGLSSVSVLLGNGDGTLGPQSLFAAAPYVNVSPGANAVAVGDFNGDGKLDWVAATDGAVTSATVALGRGDGTFQSARVYDSDNAPQWLALADFNGDGILDMVVPNNQPANDISILLGNSDGTFQAPVNIPFPAIPGVVVTGDFNNDGKQDFAVRAGFGNPSTVAVFLGNGDGTFQAPKSFSTGGTGGSYLVAGDFNGDGKLDLAVSNGDGISTGDFAILLGNGDGTFGAPIITPRGGGSTQWLAAADFNKDGHLDLIVTDNSNNDVAIFLGKGDGTFQAPTTLARQFANVAAVGDFNNDGNPDFVVTSGDGNAYVYLGRGDGTFNAPFTVILGSPPPSGPTWVAVADFNLDGNLDFVVGEAPLRGVNNGYQGMQLLLGNGDGTFQPVQDYLAGAGNVVLQPAIGDFNRDGAPDVALLDLQNSIVVLLNQTPPPLSVLPKSLSFGNQNVGTTSATQPIAVKNNGATTTTIGVAMSGDFTQSNTCPVSPATLAPTASCTINVAFKPSSTGVRNGTITVTSALPGGPQTVTLTGTGLAAVPVAMLSASSLSFNNQVVNTTSSPQTVTLTNSGGTTLHLAASGSVVISGTNASDFTVATGTTCIDGATVTPSSSCVINVTFDPSATGARSAAVTITDDASPTTQMVSLTGTGTTPTVMLNPSPVNFGNQLTGTTSGAMAITLTNSGTAALHLAASNAVAIGGTNGTDFAIAVGTTCTNGATVSASGGTCVVNITFTPGANGARTGSVSVTDDATPSPQTDALSGTGVFPAVTLSPASLSFGNQRVGTTSAAMTVTLTNSGTAPLHLAATNAVVASGTNASDFAVASGTTCTNGATVNVNATCLINVTFTPGATGSRGPTTFTITDDATPTTQSFTASGTGIFPAAQLSANTINFGNQRTGTTSAAQTITVTNNGTDALHLAASNAVAISGTNASDFAVVTALTTCTNGATVAAGANCVINITFDPAATGSRTATLTITDDANPTTQTVTLSGTGVAPAATLSGASLTFSGQLITTSSSAQTVTLTNSGTASLTISSIAVTGANSGDFSQTNTCPASSSTLAVGANCAISVTFKPTATGNRAASVAIVDDAASSPQSVSLTGTGTDYSLAAATGSNCPAGGNCSTTATISAGQTATYDLQVTPASGFNGSVAFSCTGAPGPSTCSLSPSAVPPSGSSSYAFTVTVSNTAGAMTLRRMDPPSVPRLPIRFGIPFFVALALMLMLACVAIAARQTRRLMVPALVLLLLSLGYMSGCGGGGGGPTVKPPTNATITVTGTSSGANRTLALSLTVNH